MKKELIRTERYIHIFDEAGKQLAHLPLNDSPILEGVPLLPPIEDDDVWSMGLEARLKELPYTKHLDDGMFNDGQVSGFESGAEWGYNKAKEKYKFTEEDMRKAIELSYCKGLAKPNSGRLSDIPNVQKEIIQSLSQPKTPTYFEFEMESMTIDEIREQGKGFLHAPTFKIKTTNSQGQQVSCGKYIY